MNELFVKLDMVVFEHMA